MSRGHLNSADSHRQREPGLIEAQKLGPAITGLSPILHWKPGPRCDRKEGWAVAPQQSRAGDRPRSTEPFWSFRVPQTRAAYKAPPK